MFRENIFILPEIQSSFRFLFVSFVLFSNAFLSVKVVLGSAKVDCNPAPDSYDISSCNAHWKCTIEELLSDWKIQNYLIMNPWTVSFATRADVY